MPSQSNIDPAEIEKFQALASRWWDPESEFRPLHEINPLRVSYIDRHAAGIDGKEVLDIGCGGGILAEGLARNGARVTGIDMADMALRVARLHLQESELDINYQQATVESFASQNQRKFDIITCLEVLEHIPDPDSVIAAAAGLLKPDGQLFLSTINRNIKSFLLAIVGAEYLLKLLPRGTHDYKKLIKPSELASAARANNLCVVDVTGMTYNPIRKRYRLGNDIDVNYLMACRFDD